MKRKFYTLVLTFLCLFFGQLSYGQGQEGGFDWDSFIDDLEDEYGADKVHVYDSLIDYATELNVDGAIDTNGDGTTSLNEIASYLFGFEVSQIITFAGEPAFILSNGDIFILTSGLLQDVVIVKSNNSDSTDTTPTPPDADIPPPNDPCPSGNDCECFGIGCPGEPNDPIELIWYLDFDGDGYHSEIGDTKQSDKWKTTSLGEDCDDAKPQYTTVCCTKTCESGYKLNIDTCECKLLPPCWGTIKDFETSNSFSTTKILNDLNATLGDFGISTDIMDMLKQSNVFDPKTIAESTDIATHVNAIGNIGDGSQIIMSYFEYIDEPSTHNLLKLALDSVSPFLSPAASLALSTIDFYKDSNGDSKLDLLLRAAGDYIDRQRDCNLGLGVRNAIF